MAKPSFKIISERKIIDVLPGPFRGDLDRIEVSVCTTCGSVVFDPIQHDNWHDTLVRPSK